MPIYKHIHSESFCNTSAHFTKFHKDYCAEERLKKRKAKGTELQSKSLRQSDQTYCLLPCWEKRRSKEMETHDGGKEAKKNAKWTTKLLLAAQSQHTR